MGSNSVPVSVSINTNPHHNNNHSVFVYGSLLADEVVRVLLRRIPQSFPAVLHGFHRFSIKGRVYPAILPVENMKVTGKVLLGITHPELDILDAFEDVEYERRAVNVSLLDNYENLQAHAYVWANNADENLYGEWHFESAVTSAMLFYEAFGLQLLEAAADGFISQVVVVGGTITPTCLNLLISRSYSQSVFELVAPLVHHLRSS